MENLTLEKEAGMSAAAIAARGARQISSEDLSTLSLDAAIELDRLIRDESNEQRHVLKLAETLKRTPGSEEGDSFRSLANPKTIDIFNRALHSVAHTEIRSRNDIAKQIDEYVAVLDDALNKGNKETLERLKKFFLALHDQLVSESLNGYLNQKTRPREE